MIESKKKKPIKAMLGFFIIIFVSVGIFVSEYYRDHYYVAPVISGDKPSKPVVRTLGLTPKAYGERLNQEVEGTNLQRNDWDDITAGTSTKSPSFTMTYSNDLVLTGSINEIGELDKLLYTESSNEKTNAENVPLIQLATAVGRTLHPNYSKRGVNSHIKELISQVAIEYAQTKTPQRNTIDLEGVTYTFEMSDSGLVFIVEPDDLP